MNYIYYQTKTLFSNTGDVLINKCLLTELRNYGLLKANCSSDVPKFFIEQLGIKENEKIISRNELFFITNIIRDAIKRKSKVYIFSGLGHIYGRGNKRAFRNLLACLIFAIYRLFGVKIIRIGFSMGELSKGLAITEFLRACFVSSYYVRDYQSLNRCHKLGIKKAKICPDMSWLYNHNSIRKLNEEVVVSLCFRNMNSKTNIEENDKLLDKIISILTFIKLKNNKNIKVIIAYQVKEDYVYSAYLFSKLRELFKVEFVDEQMTLDNAGDIYSKVKYNLSNRMHSLLLCYKYGVLPIPIVDFKENIKIISTFEDSNLHDLLLDVNNMDSLLLEDKLNQILENDEFYYDRIVSVENEKFEEINECLKDIFGER